MFVAKKKRKRPQAKDWPPMSRDKKYLDAYPRKLPRLLEAPYMDIWVTMMKKVKQEHRRRWIRAGFFRDLHHELFLAVPKYENGTIGLLRPMKKLDSYHGKYVKIFYTRTHRCTTQAVNLCWLVESLKMESLCWTKTSNDKVLRISCGHVGTHGPCVYIMRYLKKIDWMCFMNNFYQNGNDWDYCCDSCGRGHPLRSHKHHLEMAIRLAPKDMNRSKAMMLAKTMLGLDP